MLLIALFPTTILELLCSSQVHYWVSYPRGEGVESLVLCTTLWWSIGQPLLPGGPLNGSRNSTIHHSSFPSLFLHTLSLSFFPSIPQLLTRLGVAFHLFPTAYQFPSFGIQLFKKKWGGWREDKFLIHFFASLCLLRYQLSVMWITLTVFWVCWSCWRDVSKGLHFYGSNQIIAAKIFFKPGTRSVRWRLLRQRTKTGTEKWKLRKVLFFFCYATGFISAFYATCNLNFCVLLTVQLSIFVLIFNQLDAQNLFYNKFYFMPLHVSSTCAHHQEVKIALHSLSASLVSSHL